MNAQEAIQVFELDAVDDWKDYYRQFRQSCRFSSKRRLRRRMKQIRREAALERRIEAQEREIQQLRFDLIKSKANVLGMSKHAEKQDAIIREQRDTIQDLTL